LTPNISIFGSFFIDVVWIKTVFGIYSVNPW
jgi:hypothetical protein